MCTLSVGHTASLQPFPSCKCYFKVQYSSAGWRPWEKLEVYKICTYPGRLTILFVICHSVHLATVIVLSLRPLFLLFGLLFSQRVLSHSCETLWKLYPAQRIILVWHIIIASQGLPIPWVASTRVHALCEGTVASRVVHSSLEQWDQSWLGMC